MSFRDFFTNLQAGQYSRPVSRNAQGQSFCEQLMFKEADAEKITTLEEFDAAAAKLFTVRIRQVTGGGSYSSGTKAKLKLSLPLRATYTQTLVNTPRSIRKLAVKNGKLTWVTETIPGSVTPVSAPISISTMTLYYPSPMRIENVQHDAVLSLNDPSDPTADVVILIPLKGSNMGEASIPFFSKIAPYLSQVQEADPVTGLYNEVTIPTGSGWGIQDIFWLGPKGDDNIASVTDAYFTWTGASSFNRIELSRSWEEIRYGWEADKKQVRYFMLQNPVAISITDLSRLRSSLPETVAGSGAIHPIPDPSGGSSNPKVMYSKATGPAADAACGIVRERMSNPGDETSSLGGLFTGAGDLLVDEKGSPLTDADSCDPFKTNSVKAVKAPSLFTPTRAITMLFNVILVIAVAFGTWLALFLITNKDYDVKFQSFANDAGKVAGTLLLQTSGRLGATLAQPPKPDVPGVADAAGAAASMVSKLPGASALLGALSTVKRA
jgi:hypothetical protein